MSKNSKSTAKSYPVWIGSLHESVDESTLNQHFKQFGPIRSIQILKDNGKNKSGYVHFHNSEVAEMAAQAMQGKEIKGRKIKTKGPSLQHQHGSSNSLVELKDADKTITDCYYYIINGICKPKQGQNCMYRHQEKLRHCKKICEKWHDRSCRNKNCPKLHPSQKHEQELAKKNAKFERCASHNAFKCYGQCGKEGCNTHFHTENDLANHVTKAGLKCEECNAVFFNDKEKQQHSHTKQTKTENDTEKTKAEPIGVFWDIENCQVPKGISALAIVQKIRETFYPGRREVEFMCVCDTTKEKKEILEELNRAQINIIHINATSKNAADDKLKQSLRRFAQTHKPPATIVLISGDINFSSELSDLRHRNNMCVILIHNQQASAVLKQCAHECRRFEDFTARLPAMPKSIVDNDSPKEVIVLNLPPGNDKKLRNKISNQLKKLVDNTGGKVMHLSQEISKENTAIVRFADPEAARRAVTRLENEEVLGSKIKAKLKKLTKQAAPDCENNKENQNNKSMYNKNDSQNVKYNSSNTFQPQFAPLMPMFNPAVHNSILPMNGLVQTFVVPPGPLMQQRPLQLAIAPPPSPVQTNNNKSNSDNSTSVRILAQVNLNGPVNSKDVKKWLTTLVREHCKVLSVNIISQNKDKMDVHIRVPKLQDALLCIPKLNLEEQNVRFSLVSDKIEKEDMLMKIRTEVFSLLYDAPGKWMPLNAFLMAYKEKFKKALHVLLLDQVKDYIYVDGKPNAQFLCLLQNPVGCQKIKPAPDLKKKFANILKTHNRRVPLACFPGLYWSYTKHQLIFDDNGEILIKYFVSDDICLAGNGPQDQIVYFNKSKPKKGGIYPLTDFKQDMVELLKASPSFTIQYNRIAPLYNKYFGRQLRLVDFGYKDMNEIINALPEILEISDQKEKSVTFTKGFKKSLLSEMLQQLLGTRDKQKIKVNSLLTTFYRFYGCKLYYRYFDFASLLALVSSLDNTFKVQGTGDDKELMLTHKIVKPNKGHLKKVAREVTVLIQSKPNKRIAIHNLSSEYFKYYGRQLKLADLGFNKLNDLVLAISDYFEVHGERDQKCLVVSNQPNENVSIEDLWKDIVIVLKKSTELCHLGTSLPNVYHKKLRKPFPMDVSKISQLYRKVPTGVSVLGENNHRVLVYNNKDDYPSVLFVKQLCEIAYTYPHFKLTPQTAHEKLLKDKQIQCSYDRVEREIKKSNKFQVLKEAVPNSTDKSYLLLPEESQRLFERDIVEILNDEPEHRLLLNHFAKTYTKRFGKVLRVADYGVTKLIHLVDKLTKGFVGIDYPATGGQPTMFLGKLGKLCMDCCSVLDANAGSLLLSDFAREFQRKFGRLLRPNEYGFNEVGEILDCFTCVMNVYGENDAKVVVQKEKILIPKGNEDTAEEPGRKKSAASDSGSDSDVIIESEEMDFKETFQQNNFEETDLLQFSADEENKRADEENKQNDNEWWMDSIPNLPQPTLLPEQSFTQYADFDLDLISFTEFNDDEIRSGGIDEDALPPPIAPTPSVFSSFDTIQARKSSSDDFVDNLFSNQIPDSTSHEPDLMRMLVGRCSPADGYFDSKPIIHEQQSTTGSSISETYSMFSPLKSNAHVGASCASPSANYSEVSYSQLLGDFFNDQQMFGAPGPSSRCIRPRIAANFSKQA